jgi:hypothetical protein
MITWEHLRFLALLTPTWLVLGAVAVTLGLASKSAAHPPLGTSVVLSGPVGCKDTGDVATQQRNGELFVSTGRLGGEFQYP